MEYLDKETFGILKTLKKQNPDEKEEEATPQITEQKDETEAKWSLIL